MASIKKRGKTWYVRFSKRETRWDPEKQKNVSVLRQKSKGGFKTKAEAQEYGIKMEAASLSGVDVIKNPVFADYFKTWYETYKFPSIRKSTQKRYITNYNYIKNYFRDTKIKNITRSNYQKFLNHLGKKHAPATVRKTNIMIKSCIGNAVEDGLVERNFTNRTTITGNKDAEKHVEYLNMKELNKLVQLCLTDLNTRYTSKYLVLADIFTGARIGELSALKWSDIDFKNETINITKSWNCNTKKLGPTKTKSSVRKIKVNSFLLRTIKQLKVNNLDFVFATPRTELPPSSSAVNQFLRRTLDQGNIHKQDFHFHSLRHTHVAYLLSKGVDISAISKRLGHANIATTLKIYAYLLDEYKEKQDSKIVNSLDDICATFVQHGQNYSSSLELHFPINQHFTFLQSLKIA